MDYPVTLVLVPVEYRDGFVITPMGRQPIESRFLIAANSNEIWEACERLYRDYEGTHDAKITVFPGFTRKPAGFDKIVKANLYRLECHRAEAWRAV